MFFYIYKHTIREIPNIYWVVFVLLFFNYSIANAQDASQITSIEQLWGEIGTSINEKEDYPLAIQQLQKLITTAQQKKSGEDVLNAQFYIAYCYNELDSLSQVKYWLDETYQSAVQQFEQVDSNDVFANIYYLFGLHYQKKNNSELTAYYFEKTINLLEKGYEFSFYKEDVYNNLGNIYLDKGQYNEAIQYYKFSFFDEMSSSEKAKRYQNIAYAYQLLNLRNESHRYYFKAIDELNKIQQPQKYQQLTSRVYNNLGAFYNYFEQYDSATLWLNKALPLTDNIRGRFFYHKEKAVNLFKIGRMEESIHHFDEAFSQKESLPYDPLVARTYQQQAELYRSVGQYQKALQVYRQGLQSISRKSLSADIPYVNPNLEEVSTIPHLLWLIEAIAQTLYKNGNTQAALGQYKDLCAQLSGFINQRIVSENSKLFWLDYSRSIYEQAIPIALELGEKELALEWIQQSHGSLLFSGVKEIQAFQLGAVPDSLIQQELQFKMNITTIVLDLFHEKEKQKIAQKEKDLFVIKKQHQDLLKQIEKNYPAFYNLKYEIPTVSLSTIRNSLLDQQTGIVEYFITKDSIYSFVISKQQFEIFSQKKIADFDLKVKQYRESISHYTLDEQAYSSFVNCSQYLYQNLLTKPLQTLKNCKDLIIIPDDVLGYISFAALIPPNSDVPSKVRYDLLPYLIHNYQLSYSYSIPLFVEFSQKKKKEKKLNLIAFAPLFHGQSSSLRNGAKLNALEHNIDEVLLIKNIIEGQAYTDTSATVKNFQKHINDYQLAHLSTHANCDDINPLESKIHFYDKHITLGEIYNLPNNLEMITLSACETGVGTIAKGEGIISISRAFMYAGCESVVTSLWKVNDRQTVELMQYFYEAIASKNRKHHSLGKAQRTYLQQVKAVSHAHPFYWATFIHIGNQQAVGNESIFVYIWILLPLTALLLIAFFFYQKRK